MQVTFKLTETELYASNTNKSITKKMPVEICTCPECHKKCYIKWEKVLFCVNPSDDIICNLSFGTNGTPFPDAFLIMARKEVYEQ